MEIKLIYILMTILALMALTHPREVICELIGGMIEELQVRKAQSDQVMGALSPLRDIDVADKTAKTMFEVYDDISHRAKYVLDIIVEVAPKLPPKQRNTLFDYGSQLKKLDLNYDR